MWHNGGVVSVQVLDRTIVGSILDWGKSFCPHKFKLEWTKSIFFFFFLVSTWNIIAFNEERRESHYGAVVLHWTWLHKILSLKPPTNHIFIWLTKFVVVVFSIHPSIHTSVPPPRGPKALRGRCTAPLQLKSHTTQAEHGYCWPLTAFGLLLTPPWELKSGQTPQNSNQAIQA